VQHELLKNCPAGRQSAAVAGRSVPKNLQPSRRILFNRFFNPIILNFNIMKKIQLTLALAAMVAASTFAFAFKPAAVVHKPFLVEWVRTGTTANPDDNTWVQQSSGTCEAADDICKADFPSGYNPNAHTYSQNVANATILQDQGFVPAP